MKAESKTSNKVYIKPHFVKMEVAEIHLNVNFVRQFKDNFDET